MKPQASEACRKSPDLGRHVYAYPVLTCIRDRSETLDLIVFMGKEPVVIYTDDLHYGRYLQSLANHADLGARVAPLDRESDQCACSTGNEVKVFDLDGSEAREWERYLDRGNASIVLSERRIGKLDRNGVLFLHKPLNPADFVNSLLHLSNGSPAAEAESPGHTRSTGPYLIGTSAHIREIRRDIKKVGDTDLTVLILGETGTGKGLIALSLHNHSSRRANQYVEVNCANVPPTLMESELFGYKRGAFTGAWKDKTGKFQLAGRGTIFLDEISEMPPAMQAKLLQVLQEGEFSPIGGVDNVRVDVRIVAATNADLKRLMASGGFRLDLYYRLSVICFTLPPLKKRKEDIMPLASYFLEKYSLLYQKQYCKPSDRFCAMLEKHDWPGNVRELENTIKSLVALENEEMVLDDLRKKMRGRKGGDGLESGKSPVSETIEKLGGKDLRSITEKIACNAETEIIQQALLKTNGNKKSAAKLLQVSYKCMLNKIKEYGL
jgi:two-component system response regulator AtoC